MGEIKRMSRRRKVVVSIIGGLVVAIGGLIAAFVLSSPSSPDLPIDVAPKEIPSSWVEPGASATVEPDNAGAEPLEVPYASTEAETPTIPHVSTGRLALIGDGKPFGEEAYELTITEDRTTLYSSGRFWFKVAVATVHVTFEQTFEGDGDLRPVTYEAEFHAPLGFDRSVRATVEDDRATVERSDAQERIAIEPEKTFTLGTFSTYVLLPRLFALRSEDGSASFEVLVFGGPPNQGSDDSAADDLPVMTIERAGIASLRAGEILLEADRYLVSSDLGESEMYARDDEFLALRAGDEEGTLWVYRSDFFPDGIEIVNASP
jgi:hypothetical protein